jgi:membrane protein
MLIWIFGSFLLRWVLTHTANGSTSIYGPLAAPIVVMLWLYLLSIAVLIGAALNAAFDRIWPEEQTARARRQVVRRLRLSTLMPRLRRDEEEAERFPVAEDETLLLQRYDDRQRRSEDVAQDEVEPFEGRRG